MTGSRRIVAAALAAALALLGFVVSAPSAASADSPPLPSYDGALFFPTIHGPGDPEEFSWEVELSAGEHLEALGDQTAEVYFKDGSPMATIEAEAAHDATGAAVPTSLAVVGSNIVTLTVHHRVGNPAAGGAPFVYPVEAGPPFQVGNSTVTVIAPKNESQIREERELAERAAAEAAGCRVPRLIGRTVRASRDRLREAGCQLGEVRGGRAGSDRVVKQFRHPGEMLSVGARVAVRLGG